MKKKLLFVFAVSLALAGCEKNDPKKEPPAPKVARIEWPAERTNPDAEKAPVPSSVAQLEAQISQQRKVMAWKLTPAEIANDLAHSGDVVRQKERVEKLSPAARESERIAAVIHETIAADAQLAALEIEVEGTQGVVVLTGSVKSVDLSGRAMGLTLETDGVTRVVSRLALEG